MSKMLPRCLFWMALLGALQLVLLLLVGPLVYRDIGAADDGSKVIALFAQDAVVRRTAFAGAVGLIVTAFVFFRPRQDAA